MSRAILPEPTSELKKLSSRLCARIRQELESENFMPFSRYMDMALYEPGLGYYSAGLHKLGREGDFVTAPELGCLFAACIAHQLEEFAESLPNYDVLELGAGSGRMAADILRQIDPRRAPRNYLILERSADLRLRQQQTIQREVPQWSDRVRWLDAPPAQVWQGVLLANEVVDALAVERFRLGSGTVEQIGICTSPGESNRSEFAWSFREAPGSLVQAVDQLGLDTTKPYESEILTILPAWLQSVTETLQRGIALFIDYGYPRSEYYLPERRQGTLMCNYRHRAHDDVFFWPGLQDITAFVDFTALAEAGESCGLQLSGYTSQVMFLLGCGLDQLLQQAVEHDPKASLALQAEAKQLTLPGMMGERFQVMVLNRDFEQELRGFSLRDLSHRL